MSGGTAGASWTFSLSNMGISGSVAGLMGFRAILAAAAGAGAWGGDGGWSFDCPTTPPPPFSGSVAAPVGTEWNSAPDAAFRRLYIKKRTPRIIATPTMTPTAMPPLAPGLRPELPESEFAESDEEVDEVDEDEDEGELDDEEPVEQEKEPSNTPSEFIC